MVHYLPASEHKMLKSPLACPLQRGSYGTASESEFPNFTDFLHSTVYLLLHVGH
jgi:hypothetical protein